MQETATINVKPNTDFEVGSLDPGYKIQVNKNPFIFNIRFLITGIIFGILLVKSEVISWFRIQEMFHLQSFHMYGVIGSAVVTGIISVFKRLYYLFCKFIRKVFNSCKTKFYVSSIYW